MDKEYFDEHYKGKTINCWRLDNWVDSEHLDATCLKCNKTFKKRNIYDIISRKSKQCKYCAAKTPRKGRINAGKAMYEGKQINNWLILEYKGKNNKVTAKCLLCGNIYKRHAGYLLSGASNCCKECSIKAQKQEVLNKQKTELWCRIGERFKLYNNVEVEITQGISISKPISVKILNTDVILNGLNYASISNHIVPKGFNDIFIKLHRDGKIVLKDICPWKSKIENKIGEIHKLSTGEDVQIIDASTAHNIKVQVLSTGNILEGIYYTDLKNGKVSSERKIRSNVVIKEGDIGISKTGQSAVIKRILGNKRAIVEFEDGVRIECDKYWFKRGVFKNPKFYLTDNINTAKGSHVGTINISKVAYRLQDARDVYYFCECNKCGIKTIMNPSEMLKHKCEVI